LLNIRIRQSMTAKAVPSPPSQGDLMFLDNVETIVERKWLGSIIVVVDTSAVNEHCNSTSILPRTLRCTSATSVMGHLAASKLWTSTSPHQPTSANANDCDRSFGNQQSLERHLNSPRYDFEMRVFLYRQATSPRVKVAKGSNEKGHT
jgi:hypothetical protein